MAELSGVRRLNEQVEQMFLGEYNHSLDDKGRLTIPSRYRAALAEGAVVTRGYERYLVIYPAKAFERLAQKVNRLSPSDPENRVLLRLVFSGASDAALDKTGRVNIPQFLRDYANLDSEAVVVGAGQYIEVWSSGGWDAQLDQVNDSELNAARFATLNLSTDEET